MIDAEMIEARVALANLSADISRDFQVFRDRFGQERLEEIFTALVLVYGPPSPVGWFEPITPRNGIVEFRRVLETATGMTISLAESVAWYKEFNLWFAKQRERSGTRERK